MDRTALKSYGTQQVMTSSPAQLVALLYDKAIASLREAIQAIEAGEVERRWKANNKASEIITHLANTLDHDAGGEIAANLERLYNFMLTRLFEVDRYKDAKAAREVIGLLEPLRDSWHQLAADGTTDQELEAASAAPVPAGKTPARAGEAPAPMPATSGINLSA